MSSSELFSQLEESEFKSEFRGSLNPGGHDRFALSCEILRKVIWSLSKLQGSVHILKILNAALEASVVTDMQDDSNDLRRTALRTALDEMCDMGDVVDLGEGQWQPAPIRLIEISSANEEFLVTGGVPTSILETTFGIKISPRGALRTCQRSAAKSLSGDHVWNLEFWAGIPDESLEKWLAALLKVTFQTPSDPNVTIRAYRPDLGRKGAPQVHRWTEQTGVLTGKYLIKRHRQFGVEETRLADIRSGKVIGYGSSLVFGEARRAMYAFDHQFMNPVTAVWEDRAHDFSVILNSEVPMPEQRLFAALGSFTLPNAERYYPRMWTFSNAYRPLIAKAFQNLGVSVPLENARSAK